jgi:hypothetical protein
MLDTQLLTVAEVDGHVCGQLWSNEQLTRLLAGTLGDLAVLLEVDDPGLRLLVLGLDVDLEDAVGLLSAAVQLAARTFLICFCFSSASSESNAWATAWCQLARPGRGQLTHGEDVARLEASLLEVRHCEVCGGSV